MDVHSQCLLPLPKVHLGALLLLSVFAAGCTGPKEWIHNGFKVGPNYCTPSAQVSDAWIDSADPRLKTLGAANAQWWTTFNDPTLDRLIATASEQNLTLKAAGLRIMEARSERGVAVGNLFPQKQEMTGGYSRNAMSGNAFPYNSFPSMKHFYDNSSVSFDAAWELDFWGRFRRAIEAADSTLDARVAGYDDVLVLLQAEVAANYIQMRAYEERLELAKKNIELQTNTLRIVTLRAQAGFVTDLDVQQAIANLAGTESLVPVLATGHRKTQNRLCILLGEPPHAIAEMVKSPSTIPVPSPEVIVGIPAELLRRRPDVRRAEREAAAQSAKIGIAESEFYPHIAITGSIGVQAEQFSQLFNSNSLVGKIGPGFQWNILNYGRIKNNVAAQNARFQQAIITYRDVVLKANEEVENGIVSYLREQDRVRSLDTGTRAAAKSVEIATQQYEKGTVYYQSLLDSERVLVQQQDTLAESRGLIGIHLVSIYKALGGGWQARLASEQPQTSSVSISPTLQ
ncbi:MAG: efflux transporter outer membrane subunit [Pirellulales bacterium]|nr:efflux transporter outer membrane subunit [Pirellulales bacterium]